MPLVRRSLVVALLLCAPCLAQTTQPLWTPLFNGKDFSGWYTWLKGLGKDNDPNKVFQVHDGAIHIYKDAEHASAQPFGYFCTIKEYGDCRIRFQYKWGEKRFGGRATKKRDSGILYFVFSEDGPDGGKTWPYSVEAQIQEGDTGDTFAIGASVTSTVDPATANTKNPKYLEKDAGGVEYTSPGGGNDRIVRSKMLEQDGWNTVEVVMHGDNAVHLVNGQVNMRLSRIVRATPTNPTDCKKLDRGRILFQAEGAEVLYRNIEIAPLAIELPAKN